MNMDQRVLTSTYIQSVKTTNGSLTHVMILMSILRMTERFKYSLTNVVFKMATTYFHAATNKVMAGLMVLLE